MASSYTISTIVYDEIPKVVIGATMWTRAEAQALVLHLQAWLDTGSLHGDQDYADLRAAADACVQERLRQTSVKGYDNAHDDAHMLGELADAAAAYALEPDTRDLSVGGKLDLVGAIWPFEPKSIKFTPADRGHELTKAGGLLLAEMTRRTRAARRVHA